MLLLERITTYLTRQRWFQSARRLFRTLPLTTTTLFLAYRWLAWILAVVVVVWFRGVPVSEHLVSFTPATFLLLLMSGGVAFGLTVFRHQYTWLAQQYPPVLAGDILVCSMLVWGSGGGVLPFLPYALSSLILPTMFSGLRAGVLALVALVLPVQLLTGLPNLTNPDATIAVFLRVMLPLLFVFGLEWLSQKVRYKRDTQAVSPLDFFTPDMLPGRTAQHVSTSPDPWGLWSERYQPPDMPGKEPPIDDLTGSEGQPDYSTTRLAPARATPRTSQHNSTRRRYLCTKLDSDVAFSATLRQMIERFAQQSTVAVELHQTGTEQPVSPASALTLLRLVEETLYNIHQHAQATHASVTLHHEPHALLLVVQDNGVGLLDGTHERPGFHSLWALSHRLAELDGSLEVQDQHGGVTVRGFIPRL